MRPILPLALLPVMLVAAEPSKPCAIRGRVLDSHRKPVAGARVRIDGAASKQATTGADGRFQVADLGAGAYRIAAEAQGIGTATQQVLLSQGHPEVEVSLQVAPQGLEVTVTATRGEATIATIPAALTVMESEQIVREAAASKSVADLLGKSIPGLGFSSQNFSLVGQSLRGRDLSVLIDGVPQSTTRNVSRDLMTVDVSALERVEVLRGPTALYGDGATGGVVNLITKGPEQEGLVLTSGLSANVSLAHPDGSLGSKLTQGISWRKGAWFALGSASFEKTAGFFDAEGDRIAPDPNQQGGLADTKSTQVFTKVGWEPDANQRLQLSGSRFEAEQHTDFISDPAVNKLAYQTKSRTVGGFSSSVPEGALNTLANLDYSHRALLGGTLHAQAYYRDYTTVFIPFDRRGSKGGGQQVSQSFILSDKAGGRLDYQRALVGEDTLVLLAGFDYAREKTSQPVNIMDRAIYDQSGGRTFTITGTRSWTPPMLQKSTGLFAQLEWRATDRLTLRGGLRSEAISLDVRDFTTLDNAYDKTGKPVASPAVTAGGKLAYDTTLKNLGVVFMTTPQTQVFLNYSEGFSLADVGRVLRAAPAGFTVAQMNPGAQTVKSLEAGWRGYWERVQASVSVFGNRSDLGTTFDKDLNLVRSPERIYGMEATVDGRIGRAWKAGGTLSWYEGQNEPKQDGNWAYLSAERIQPLKATAFLEHETAGRWTNRVQVLHSGSRDRFNNALGYGLGRASTFTTLDFDSRRPLGPGTAFLSVQNLLNRLYYPYASMLYADTVRNSSRSAASGAVLSIGYQVRY